MAENNLNQMRFIQPIRSVVGFPTYEGAIGHVNGLIPEFSSNAKSDGVSVVARYKDGTDAEGKDIYKMLHAIYSKKDNKFTFFVHDVESLKEIESKISSLETAVGEGGFVSQQINDAIGELDADKSSNASYVNVTVKQTDGKIESVTIDETNLSNLIEKLEGDENVKGSIANAVANAKSELLGDVKDGDATTIGGLNEKIEAVEGAAKSYSIVAVTGVGDNVKEAWQLQQTIGTASTLVGETIKIYKDSSLKSVELVEEKPVEGGGSEKGQFLKFTYITSEGEDDIVYLNVSSFLAQSEFKDGLQVSESGEVSVKLDGSTEDFLTVGSDGIKLSGVQDAINAVATSSSEALDELIGKPEGDDVPKDYDTIYEIAKELEKLEGDETVEGSIASDIKKAIDEIDVPDAAVAGSYVSQVSQTDGKISVERVALPTVEEIKSEGKAIIAVGQELGTVSATFGDIYASSVGMNGYSLVTYPTVEKVTFEQVTDTDKVDSAISKVESNISTLIDEVLKNETVCAAAFTEIKNSIGLDENLKYVVNTDATYISNATSLSEADNLLDTAIKKNASDIEDLKTAVGEGGSVSQQINNAIGKLDATVTSSIDNIGITIIQTDGKLTSVELTQNDVASAQGLADEISARTKADEDLQKAIDAAVAAAISVLAKDDSIVISDRKTDGVEGGKETEKTFMVGDIDCGTFEPAE